MDAMIVKQYFCAEAQKRKSETRAWQGEKVLQRYKLSWRSYSGIEIVGIDQTIFLGYPECELTKPEPKSCSEAT